MNIFKKMIRWARVTLGGSDDKPFPVQQVEFMGKTGDCVMVFPFGMHANADVDSLVLMFSAQGDSANRAGIPFMPQGRPEMAEGEVCLYHPGSGSIIHLKSNGDIDLTAPSVNINGDANITGDLTVTGATALSDTVTSNGVNISDTHSHTQANDSAGNTEVPVGPPF